MSNNNLKCKNCGSNNLIYYCEKIMTEYKREYGSKNRMSLLFTTRIIESNKD